MIWHLVSFVVGIVIGVTGTIIYAAAFCSEEDAEEFDPSNLEYEALVKKTQKEMAEPRDQHSPEITQYNDYTK